MPNSIPMKVEWYNASEVAPLDGELVLSMKMYHHLMTPVYVGVYNEDTGIVSTESSDFLLNEAGAVSYWAKLEPSDSLKEAFIETAMQEWDCDGQ